MIEIDGSFGEGGGQILRTALSLSCLFRKPFRIFNIRKGRKNPGLMPQHLAAVRSAQSMSDADVQGSFKYSTELFFYPKTIKHRDIFFDIGTAGSTMLVLQTLLPALVFSEGRSRVGLKGGTHVPFSPSFHYVEGVFLRILEQLGIKVMLAIESYGFYPKGGGTVTAEIFPSKGIRCLNVEGRGEIKSVSGYSGVANLSISIAERQKKAMIERIKPVIRDIPLEVNLISARSIGQGTFVYLLAESEHSIAGFGSLGERGRSAETVGVEAADDFLRYYRSGMAFDEHLADQIVLYLSLCKERSVFTTSRITHHLMTNLCCIRLFHDFQYEVQGNIGESGRVKINC